MYYTASMRPPLESGGYNFILDFFNSHTLASMRPPLESGGYGPPDRAQARIKEASMRPPLESGGYTAPPVCCHRSCSCFNEAAARKRRIRRVGHKLILLASPLQ